MCVLPLYPFFAKQNYGYTDAVEPKIRYAEAVRACSLQRQYALQDFEIGVTAVLIASCYTAFLS